jgi:hypothetical protein
MNAAETTESIPGADLVAAGLLDLELGKLTQPALLVLIAAPRLRRLGFKIAEKNLPEPCEHLLFGLLNKELGPGAHSYYNSLIRRIVSFARALEREQTLRQ